MYVGCLSPVNFGSPAAAVAVQSSHFGRMSSHASRDFSRLAVQRVLDLSSRFARSMASLAVLNASIASVLFPSSAKHLPRRSYNL